MLHFFFGPAYFIQMFRRLLTFFRPVILVSPVVVAAGYKLFKQDPISLTEDVAYKLQPRSLSYLDNPNKHHISRIPKTVCIVGAGRTGCAAAKVLSQQGYQVDIYDKNSSFGGKWLTNKSIGNGHLPAKHYIFSDMKINGDEEALPSYEDLYKYLEEYVDRFNLKDLMHFNSPVVDITLNFNGSWNLVFANDSKKTCDYLILAGKSNEVDLPHKELLRFKGKYFHSSRMAEELDSIKDKDVVIIGEDSSAIDCVLAASKHGAKSVSHIRNRDVWILPLKETVLGLPIEYVYNSRFSLLFLHRYNTAKNTYFTTLGKPFKALYWLVIEKAIKNKLPECLQSKHSLKDAITSGEFMVEDEYIDKVRKGDITVIRNLVVSSHDRQLNLTDCYVEADVLIFATRKQANFVGYLAQEEGVWNYMNIIKPGAKNLAFLNSTNGPMNGVYTELCAVWLSEMLRGAVILPSMEFMENDTNLRSIFIPRQLQLKEFNFNYWNHIDEIDRLLDNMNIRTMRKPSVWNNLVEPLQPEDYKLVLTHRL